MTGADAGPPGPREPLVRRETISEALRDPATRARMGMPSEDDAPLDVMIELNVRYPGGPEGARRALTELLARLAPQAPAEPRAITGVLVVARLSFAQLADLVAADAAGSGRAIHRVWPDFPVHPLIDRSVQTVKADAAVRTYDATGEGIVWAVVDSGVDGGHRHFRTHDTLGGPVADLHRDFTKTGDAVSPLTDRFGHGTHVAGIIAGELPRATWTDAAPVLYERVADPVSGTNAHRTREPEGPLSGVAPRCRLVSLKVLGADGGGSTSRVIEALRHVREINAAGPVLRIHGVNLSIGYEFDARWFACGQSPLCVEIDQLVRTGVVVVVAAGNTGYGTLRSTVRETSSGMALTINDPGNAELAITVGATHRHQPHTYGVSYFSSKGPTGDGRGKPDLVAPGERITSCATGGMVAEDMPGSGPTTYVDQDGTSMAAPHVSGAVAAFLSIRSEFVARPDRVKRLFVDGATSLGRARDFQGSGLLDVMRTIGSV